MPKYEVTGEYGPQAGMSITLEIEADNEVDARDVFCERMEADHPVEWARMGLNNVRYIELIDKPKAEPKPPHTVWEVFFKNRFSELVRAHTFIDAVEEAKRVCRENNLPLSEIKWVKYLMY